MTKRQLRSLHDLSISNKELVQRSVLCGCFYCLEISPADAIGFRNEQVRSDSTALCPFCGVDSIIPDSVVALSTELLVAIRIQFFDASKTKEEYEQKKRDLNLLRQVRNMLTDEEWRVVTRSDGDANVKW